MTHNSQLQGKVALVTAAGAGIGQATAWFLAARGAEVMAADIDAAGLAQTLADAPTPARTKTIVSDATTLAGADAAVGATVKAFGNLHILANVVGGSKPGKTVVDMPVDEWDYWVKINLTSTYLMCKAAIPAMAKSGGGSIVNISSGAGVRGMTKNPAYVAAKGGVVALTKSLAFEYGEHGIRSNVIVPGTVKTPRVMKMLATEVAIQKQVSQYLMGLIEPQDVTYAAIYLASDESLRTTAQTIGVDSGFLNTHK